MVRFNPNHMISSTCFFLKYFFYIVFFTSKFTSKNNRAKTLIAGKLLKLDDCMVGLVIIRARHSAKIRAKKGYFTRYLVLKDAISFSVCPSNVIYIDIST
jgi:hypothetical protein